MHRSNLTADFGCAPSAPKRRDSALATVEGAVRRQNRIDKGGAKDRPRRGTARKRRFARCAPSPEVPICGDPLAQKAPKAKAPKGPKGPQDGAVRARRASFFLELLE